MKFPGGTGDAKQKTFRGGSMDIFWNCRLVKIEARRKNLLISIVPDQ